MTHHTFATSTATMPLPSPPQLAKTRSALSLVSANTYSPNSCGFQKAPTLHKCGAARTEQEHADMGAAAKKQHAMCKSEQAGAIRAAPRSAPAPLPFSQYAGLSMTTTSKCPLYGAGASGPTKAQIGTLKLGTDVHVLEEKAEFGRTWLRCKQGWVPLTEEEELIGGKKLLRVLEGGEAVPTPTGRQVVADRQEDVKHVLESMNMETEGESSCAWSTAGGDELVLTFVTKGRLDFDVDLSTGRVISVSKAAVAPVSTDLTVGMTLTAIQGRALTNLSSKETKSLWSSTAHRRPLALTFQRGAVILHQTVPAPAAASISGDSTNLCSSGGSSDAAPSTEQMVRIGGRIARNTATEAELCAAAAEAAWSQEISNSRLDSNRWDQLVSGLAEAGWMSWNSAKRLGEQGGEALVGKRVAVLGEGFGTVQSFESSRFGGAVHQISFEGGTQKGVKLEKKGAQWLLYSRMQLLPQPEQEEDREESDGVEDVLDDAQLRGTICFAPESLGLSPAIECEFPLHLSSPFRQTAVEQPEVDAELTPMSAPVFLPTQPGSTIKITLD